MLPKLIGSPGIWRVSGRYGIPSPKVSFGHIAGRDRLRARAGVCFGPLGGSAGRGGGYYDRFLEGFSGFSAGVCRGFAFGAPIPEFPHDRRVNAVVTEDGVTRF
jgi:5-formyltetrahydrofolate cyclo-ligase